MRRLGAALVALALLITACGGDDDAATTEPTATAQTDSPTPAAAPTPDQDVVAADAPLQTTVRFTTPDGEELEGTIFGDGAGGVVLAHMRGRDRTTWQAFAEAAAAAGHRVLSFDFRGYGGSTGQRDTELDVDLTTAIRFLADQGVVDVVAMGASMGGTATVNVAAQLTLAGAVSLSAPADFLGLPATAVAADVDEPLLLVAAENDEPYASAAREMDELAPATQLQVFAGNAHGTNLFAEHGEPLTQLLLAFLDDRLG